MVLNLALYLVGMMSLVYLNQAIKYIKVKVHPLLVLNLMVPILMFSIFQLIYHQQLPQQLTNFVKALLFNTY